MGDVEPLTIIVFGKTYGSANWELVVRDTVGRRTLLSESTYFCKRSEIAKRVAKAVADRMIDPSSSDVKSAHRQNLWPCSVMCTLHYQQWPSPLNPRLVVFLYGDKWMVFDKYSQTEGYAGGDEASPCTGG